MNKLTNLIQHVIKSIHARKWEKIKATLLVGVEENKVYLYKTLLDNQRNHQVQHRLIYTQPTTTGWRQLLNSPYAYQPLDGFIYEVVKSTLDKLTGWELVAVQPMVSPLALSYTMQYKESDPIVEGDHKRLSMEVVGKAVQAETRPLPAVIPIEIVQDMSADRITTLQTELITAISLEVEKDINAEILNNLVEVAEVIEELDASTFFTGNSTAIQQLLLRINVASNRVATRTRRGAGNWVVFDVQTMSHIYDHRGELSDLVKFIDSPTIAMGSLLHVGYYRDTVKLYVSTSIQDTILVGYKGRTTEVDAGLMVCPYIPIMLQGPAIHPVTFEPLFMMYTRQGKVFNDGPLVQGSEYYKQIKVKPS